MFTKELLINLTAPNERLQIIADILLNQIWSSANFEKTNPIDYLKNGENTVNKIEDLLTVAAPNFYSELIDNSIYDKSILSFLTENCQEKAAVILDGVSIREIPVILSCAKKANFKIVESGFSLSAAPSDTLYFINEKLECGLTAPSVLPSNKILKSKNIDFYYYSQVMERKNISGNDNAILLWSAFPDSCYSDSNAKTPDLFNIIIKQLETVFQNTVQEIPHNRKILITSDHGYVFLGAGSALRSDAELQALNNFFGNSRFEQLDESEMPADICKHPDVYYHQNNNCAIVRGRVLTKSRGQAAVKLYKHGGISLMESIVPWIVLEKIS